MDECKAHSSILGENYTITIILVALGLIWSSRRLFVVKLREEILREA